MYDRACGRTYDRTLLVVRSYALKLLQSFMGQPHFDLGTSLLGLNWAIYLFSYLSPSAQILPITKTTWGMKLYFIHWYKCDTGFTREVRVNLEFESSTWTETVQS